MSTRILLVEDDPTVIQALSELLEAEGHVVECVSGQADAITRASQEEPDSFDLVLMDVSLAEGNGFSACGAIKAHKPDLPVIFLTASSDEYNTVAGLAMGADDYIAKPFRPRELLARVSAALRRSRPGGRSVNLGPIHIDTERAHVEREGRELTLSALEYRLLLLFALHPGKLITRDAIRDALWDDAGTYIEENTLSVYIKRLRDKIETDPTHPELIQTVRGLGYKALNS